MIYKLMNETYHSYLGPWAVIVGLGALLITASFLYHRHKKMQKNLQVSV